MIPHTQSQALVPILDFPYHSSCCCKHAIIFSPHGRRTITPFYFLLIGSPLFSIFLLCRLSLSKCPLLLVTSTVAQLQVHHLIISSHSKHGYRLFTASHHTHTQRSPARTRRKKRALAQEPSGLQPSTLEMEINDRQKATEDGTALFHSTHIHQEHQLPPPMF